MKLQRLFLLCGALSISALNSGCNDKQDATVYKAAKETPAPATAAPKSDAMPVAPPSGHPTVGAAGDMPAIPSGKVAPEVNVGAVPAQWKMKAPTSMRLASFEVTGEKGATADISLIILNGAAGGVLDNVNRWQSQLGQPDLTAESLAQKAQIVDSPLGKITVVDIQGLPKDADAAKDGRIVAGIVPNDGMVFFFKMRGNAELVGAQKEDFLKWMSKVQIGADKTSPDTVSPSPTVASPAPDNAPAPEASPIPAK